MIREKTRTVFVGHRVKRILGPRARRATLRIATSDRIEYAVSRERLRSGHPATSTLPPRGFAFWSGPAPQIVYARRAPDAEKEVPCLITITEGIA